MKEAITHNISVRVKATYKPEHSLPHLNKFVHAYHVIIENLGDREIKLLGRHWNIVNALGENREVKGLGVIGEQPLLHPGEIHEYDSWSPMNTEVGKMYGKFIMIYPEDGSKVEVVIPEFPLVAEYIMN